MSPEGAAIRIRFDHVGSGLRTRDGSAPTCFQIAGSDRKFAAAQAEIHGDTVLVRSAAVPQPVAVRYLWEWPAEPNLCNREGLPAASFRTDDWD